MRLAHLASVFWVAGFLGHVILLCVLLIRHRWARFPFFTTLIAANVVRSVILYCTFRAGPSRTYPYAYFYAYWACAILDVALQLSVAYEMAAHVFKPLGDWSTDVRRSLFWLICGSISVALVLTWLAAPAAVNWREVLVIRGSFFSAALMSELFVGMVALSVMAGLPWRTHVARITQGLGVYSMVCVLVAAGDTHFGLAAGTPISIALSRFRMGVYLLCVGYWIVMLWRDEPQPKQLPEEMRRLLSLLQARTAYDLQRIKGRRLL